MNYQLVTGVLLSHKTPVLLNGSGALALMSATRSKAERCAPWGEGQSDLCDAFFLSAEWSSCAIVRAERGQWRNCGTGAGQGSERPRQLCRMEHAEWSTPNGKPRTMHCAFTQGGARADTRLSGRPSTAERRDARPPAVARKRRRGADGGTTETPARPAQRRQGGGAPTADEEHKICPTKGGAWRVGAPGLIGDPQARGGARPKQYADNRAQKYAVTMPERA